MPIYDKPMIYYPLSTLMLAGIRDILVITTPHDQAASSGCSGDGSALGMRFAYAAQPRPEGLAQAFLIGRDFVGARRVALALGDNIFYGNDLVGVAAPGGGASARAPRCSPTACAIPSATAWWSSTPPAAPSASRRSRPQPRSPYAVTGLYFYDNRGARHRGRACKPSAARRAGDHRREPGLPRARASCSVEMLGRGMAWLDTGTQEALLQASNFIQAIEQRQGLKVACPEEVAYKMGFIDAEDVLRMAAHHEAATNTAQYLERHDRGGGAGQA